MILFVLSLFSFIAAERALPVPSAGIIDTTAPFVQVTVPPGLYNRPLEIRFTTNEQATIYYTVDGTTPTDKSTEYSGLLTISAEGRTELRYFASDIVGNRSEEKIVVYRVDTHAPKVDITPRGGVFAKDVEVKLLTSEPASIYYSLCGSDFVAYKGRIVIGKPCSLKAYAIDEAGNRSDEASAVYSFEKSMPVVKASEAGGLFDKPFKLTLSSTEGVKIRYSFDEFAPISSFLQYVSPLNIKAGQTILSFYGENSAGVRSDLSKLVFTVDIHPPKVSAVMKTTGEKRSVQIRSNEKAVITYTIDGTAPTEKSIPYTGPISVPKKGVLDLRVYARDAAGNFSNDFRQRFTSETEPPKIFFSPAPGTYNKPFRISITTSDSARIFYSLDNNLPGENSLQYVAPISVTKDGRVSVTCQAVDINGVRSGFASAIYTLDQTPPKVLSRITKGEDGKTFEIAFEIDVKDILYFTTDGSEPSFLSKKYEKPFTVNAGGRVRYFAVDTVGNRTDVSELTEIALPSVSAAPPGGVYRRAVRVSLTSNMKSKIFYRIKARDADRGDFLEYGEPLFFNANGLYKVEYFTENLQGARSSIREESYFIDLYPPDVNVYSKRNIVDSTITLYFECSENASIYYTTDGSNPERSPTASVIGNKLFLSKDKLVFPLRDTIRINFIAEDMAGNRSMLYQFDANLPTVLATPAEGKHNKILHVVLSTFNDATIYYSIDGKEPTERSQIYRSPIPVTKSTRLRYFAMDQYGYKGKIAGGDYILDLPPRPDFVVEPSMPLEGTPVMFDASMSVDEESGSDALRYRWDIKSDSVIESGWSSNPQKEAFFQRPGRYSVSLEVMDPAGLVSRLTREVKIYKNCPVNMVSLFAGEQAFCIDKYEFPNIKGELPHTGASWVEAEMRCRSVGKRLCRFTEWRAACVNGRESNEYPWGAIYSEEKCNTSSTEVEVSGKRKRCVGDNGVYDLTGNVWEWVADREGGYNKIAGGDFSYGKNARCSSSFPELLSSKNKSVGFRCCK